MIYEAAKKALAGSKDGAIVIAVLGVFLCSSKSIGPMLEPFLVGRWEATMTLDSNAGHRESRYISLSLYDDNVALFEGIKESWKFADVSRSVVLIETPRQDKAQPHDFYELQIYRKELLQLSGTMKHSGNVLKFRLVERGGAVGVIAEAIREEQRQNKEFVVKICQQTGWRRTVYAAWHWSFTNEGWISCGGESSDKTQAREAKGDSLLLAQRPKKRRDAA